MPATPSKQARVFPKHHLWHSFNVEIVTQNFLHAGKLCLRPGTVKQEAHHQHLQNKRTTSSGGVLDVTAAMSETLMVLV